MVQIPENQVTQKDLEEWYKTKEKLGKLKVQEEILRRKIFGGWFPNAVEGVNKLDLPDGYVLKATRIINRSVDDAAFRASQEELAKAGIPTDQIVAYKPELKVGVYRKLTDEQIHLMDTVLIVKDGMPQMEIVKPKRA